MFTHGGPSTVAYNNIRLNHAGLTASGVFCGTGNISYNDIVDNTSELSSGSIHFNTGAMLIEANTIYGNQYDGINGHSSFGVIIRDNLITGCLGNGIDLYCNQQCEACIRNNTVSDCGGTGILCLGTASYQSSIVNNVAVFCSTGLYTSGS